MVNGSKTNLIALLITLQKYLNTSIRNSVIDSLLCKASYEGKSQAELNEIKQNNAILRLYLMYYEEHKELINWKAFFKGSLCNNMNLDIKVVTECVFNKLIKKHFNKHILDSIINSLYVDLKGDFKGTVQY